MPRGVVAAGSRVAAEAGAEILERGGNAADAALAAMLAAFLSEPLIASAAGGGVMLAGDARSGYGCLEFIPPMPGLGLATRPQLDFHPIAIDFGAATQTFYVGRGAAAVPIGCAGLHAAHARWGRMSLREVIAPAVRLCREGAVVSEMGAKLIALIEPIWKLSPECARLYTIEGRAATAGDRLYNPDFGETLVRLAEEGPSSFYEGDVAARIAASFGPAAGGLITREDLARCLPVAREPLRVPLWGGEVLTAPPRSTGGVLIALGLLLLHRAQLSPGAFLRAEHVRAVVDVQLATLAARRRTEHDGAFAPSVAELLLSPAGVEEAFGQLGRIEPSSLLAPARPGKGGTTHVSALDGAGGAASITISYGEGCGHVVPGTGVVMNNFLGEEDINPAGFHALAAGATLTTMMAPTLFLRDGRAEVALGSGGANRLRTAILQVLLNHVGLGQPLDVAVRAPRIHAEPHGLYAEPCPSASEEIERQAGRFPAHTFFPAPNLFFGGVNAVASSGGDWTGHADERRQGAWVIVP